MNDDTTYEQEAAICSESANNMASLGDPRSQERATYYREKASKFLALAALRDAYARGDEAKAKELVDVFNARPGLMAEHRILLHEMRAAKEVAEKQEGRDDRER